MLGSLLTERTAWAEAVEKIAADPELRAECFAVGAALEADLAPASREATVILLTKYWAVHGGAARRPEEMATIFGVYLETLSGLPLAAIADAFRRWSRAEPYPDEPGRCAFFPKPAELFALAKATDARMVEAAARARKVCQRATDAPRIEKTAEDRAAAKAEMIAAGILDASGRVILPRPASAESVGSDHE